jgi:hypothetical protein
VAAVIAEAVWVALADKPQLPRTAQAPAGLDEFGASPYLPRGAGEPLGLVSVLPFP